MISGLGSIQNYTHVVFHKYYMMVIMVSTEAKCQPLLFSLGISNRQLRAVNRPVTSFQELQLSSKWVKKEGFIFKLRMILQSRLGERECIKNQRSRRGRNQLNRQMNRALENAACLAESTGREFLDSVCPVITTWIKMKKPNQGPFTRKAQLPLLFGWQFLHTPIFFLLEAGNTDSCGGASVFSWD